MALHKIGARCLAGFLYGLPQPSKLFVIDMSGGKSRGLSLEYHAKPVAVDDFLNTQLRYPVAHPGELLKLREGVTFHDGTAFDAEAVEFSFERMLAIGQGASWMFAEVLAEDPVEVVDSHTVRFHLVEPLLVFPHMLTSTYGAPIVSPSVMDHEKDGDWGHEWLQSNSAGTGPYVLKEWVRNDRIALERKEEYWQGWREDSIYDVIFRIIPESSSQRLSLLEGSVDAATGLTAEDVEELQGQPEVTVVQAEPDQSNVNWYMILNPRKGIFESEKMREALSWAFPYEETVEGIFMGQASQGIGPVPAALPGHSDDVIVYHRDLEKAQQLMGEAGLESPDGIEVEVTYPTESWLGQRLYDVLSSTLADLISPSVVGGPTIPMLITTWGVWAEPTSG